MAQKSARRFPLPVVRFPLPFPRVALELHGKGFTDISMATGHSLEKFSHLPWLRVTGKEPPWA